MDRAGLTGPDGPTHHGLFDIGYMRVFPNMVLMAPAYAAEVEPMLKWCLEHEHPTGIRYPKASALELNHNMASIELGRCEWLREGTDGTIVAYGAMLEQALAAADSLGDELSVGVVNARFVKPIDAEMVARTLSDGRFVVTVEEGCHAAGFGSAFLESAVAQRLDTRNLKVLALPDRFIDHGDRNQLLADVGISPEGIAKACREMLELTGVTS